MNVKEILGNKYNINDEAFTIQYLHQTGHVSMCSPHAHSSYELYYVLNGGRVFFINGTVYTARKGDMIFLYPNDVHRTTSSDALFCERILVNFNYSFLQLELSRCSIPLLEEISGGPLIRFPVHIQVVIEELLQKMLLECENKHVAYETYVRVELIELLIQIHRHTLKENVEQNTSEHPMHQKITEIAVYLNEHFHEKVTLQEVANHFYISPSYLSRTFKKITGFHFKEYLQIIRLREAKRLLRESDDQISQIAMKTGFEHPANFNVTFKRLTGVTPLSYRRSQISIKMK